MKKISNKILLATFIVGIIISIAILVTFKIMM